MLSTTLFGSIALALLLLQGAATQTVTLLGGIHEQCKLDRLQRNYFHAVTCFGFVRVSFKYQTYESFNAKVDGILEEAKKQREAAGKDVNCSTHSVTPFYYSATELLIVRYPKVHKGDKLQEDERDVSYWIANVTGMTDQFVSFPESQNWTLIGKGYWEDKFNRLSAAKRKNAVCDPQFVWHNMRDKKIKFHYSVFHLDSRKFETNSRCKIDRTQYYVRYDPTLANNTKRYGAYGFKDAADRDDYFATQHYEVHSFQSRRERNHSDQYYFLFGEVDQESLDLMIKGVQTYYKIKSTCILRKFRHELGEQNVAYILPQDSKTNIITDGDEFVTTTTIPTTTIATTASTTTKPPTTTQRRETAKGEEKTTTKEADEREYTDPEEEFTPAPVAVGFNSRQEPTVSASSSIRLGMIVFFVVFAVDILL